MGFSPSSDSHEFNLWPSVPSPNEAPGTMSFGNKYPESMFKPNPLSDTEQQKATKDRRLSIIAELSKKGKVSFDVEGNSDTGYFIAEKLPSQEAVEAVKLFTELTKIDNESFDVGEEYSDLGSFYAKKLDAVEAVELIENISQGNIDVKELSEQGWREDKGELTGFINSVVELANETPISVVAGLVGGFLVAFFGPVGGILTGLGLAAMEKTIQKNYSVSSGILGGELFAFFGPVGAILIPLGVGVAVNLLPDKKSHE